MMRKINYFSTLIFFVIVGTGIGLAFILSGLSEDITGSVWTGIIFSLLAIIVSSAIKVANQWERAVVLRLGHFRVLRGPGLFLIIPVIDTIPYWIDIRVITTTFRTEKTLTKDTVPVDVDAVLFWKVINPQKAAL